MMDKSIYDNFYLLFFTLSKSRMICDPQNSVKRRYEYMSEEFINSLPKEYIHRYGRKLDVGMCRMDGSYIVSQKAKMMLEKEHITGITFIPISLQLKNGEICNDYFIMVITGTAQESTRKDSEFWYYGHEGRGMIWNDVGYFFSIESWDGSDVFVLKGRNSNICISEKAKKIFSKFAYGFNICCCRTFEWPVKSVRISSLGEKVSLERAEEINGFKIETEFGCLHSEEFCVGDIIEHQTFGEGTIINIENKKAVVSFKKFTMYDSIILDLNLSGITKIIRKATPEN